PISTLFPYTTLFRSTINPVIVCNDSNKLKLLFGVEPAAIDTIIVSPIARDVASTIEATIPDNAAGNTTLNTVSSCVAPSPYDPSRIVFGTLAIASSVKLVIIGKIINPTTKPGLIALK